MVYKYNGILFRLEKEGNSYTCYNMNEPYGHYAKCNKPKTNKKACIADIIMKEPYVWGTMYLVHSWHSVMEQVNEQSGWHI